MDGEGSCKSFLQLVANNNLEPARKKITDVQRQITTLPSNLTDGQNNVITKISTIIWMLHKFLDGEAVELAKDTEKEFKIHNLGQIIQENVRKNKPTPVNSSSLKEIDYDQTPEKAWSDQQEKWIQSNEIVRTSSEQNQSTQVPRSFRNSNRQQKPDSTELHISNERRLSIDSKRASQAMKQNNPNIADLSDVNRPTKLAERFSELYDNEWTEAFDVLCNKKKRDGKESIQLLLYIIEARCLAKVRCWMVMQERYRVPAFHHPKSFTNPDTLSRAYAFCKKEAGQQIDNMHLAILDILEHGNLKEGKLNETKKSKPVDGSLLVQYRKEYASKAINRLQQSFFENEITDVCKKFVGTTPGKNGVMAKYGNKAVELTWWMVVQDPPVYMVPSASGEFSRDLYRPYTKTGTNVDNFVWPALRLYEHGSILIKGVIQCK